MARIALIKIFTGLNLAPAQLSGELLRAGHSSRIIYFKDHNVVDIDQIDQYKVTDYPGILIGPDGGKKVWNCYKPFSEHEFSLLIQELNEFKPSAIGFSVVSGIINEAAEVTAKLRTRFNVPFIWGGSGPTLEPERCIEFADVLCINEGEEVIVEIANRLDAGAPLTDIQGTWAKDAAGHVFKHGNRPLLNLDSIAMPDWDMANYAHINRFKGRRSGIYPNNLAKEYPIMTQRGCPFSCSFCIESRYQDMFGKKDSLRRRSIDAVIEELLWAKNNLDIEKILFYDDVFTVNPRWLKEFLPRYKQEIGLPFWCYTYPTTHTPELLALLQDAGMISVTMGIQSGSARILKDHFNRPTDTVRVLEAAHEIVALGSSVRGFFDLISKVPFETEEDLRATFDFLLELPKELCTVGFGEMTNFPSYSFTEQVEKTGVIARQSQPSDATYDYYHKLYLLTRGPMPMAAVREIGDDPRYREDHQLLDDLLSNNERHVSFASISF